jgi:hypothetical protein
VAGAAVFGVKRPVTGLRLNVFGTSAVSGLNGFAAISPVSGETGVLVAASGEGVGVFNAIVFKGGCAFACRGTGSAFSGFDGGKKVGVNVSPIVVEVFPGLDGACVTVDCVLGVAVDAGMAGVAGVAIEAAPGRAGVAGIAGVAGMAGVAAAVGFGVAAGCLVPAGDSAPGAVGDEFEPDAVGDELEPAAEEFDELSDDAESSVDGSAEATACPVATPSEMTIANTEERKT